MPRLARGDVGGEVYHVINRANGRVRIFNDLAYYLVKSDVLLGDVVKKIYERLGIAS